MEPMDNYYCREEKYSYIPLWLYDGVSGSLSE